VVQMSGHIIECIPVTLKQTGLEAVEIGQGDEEPTSGPKKFMGSLEHRPRLRQMLQDVPESDHIK